MSDLPTYNPEEEWFLQPSEEEVPDKPVIGKELVPEVLTPTYWETPDGTLGAATGGKFPDDATILSQEEWETKMVRRQEESEELLRTLAAEASTPPTDREILEDMGLSAPVIDRLLEGL